eukprot:1148782_1
MSLNESSSNSSSRDPSIAFSIHGFIYCLYELPNDPIQFATSFALIFDLFLLLNLLFLRCGSFNSVSSFCISSNLRFPVLFFIFCFCSSFNLISLSEMVSLRC